MGDRVERVGRSLPSWLLRRSPGPTRRTLALAAGLGFLGELALSQLWGETRFDTIVPAWVVALVTLPAFIAALWRYAHPWPVFIVALVQTVVFAIIFPDSLPMLAVLLGLHGIARQRPLRDSLIALACLVLAIVVATPIAVDISVDESLGDAFFYIAGAVVLYAAAGVVVILLGHSQQVTATLQATRAQVYDAIIEVRLQEDRLRLARDLHDKVANSIAAVTLGLDGIRRIQPDLPAPATETLDLITESSQLAMQETREIVTVLRGEDGEDEPELEDLESTLMQMQALGWADVDVDVTSIGESVPLSPAMDECATRCVRDAVTNAANYGISSVAVEVDWREDPFTISIRNGHGPANRLPDRAFGSGAGLGRILLNVIEVGGTTNLHIDDAASVLRLALPRR